MQQSTTSCSPRSCSPTPRENTMDNLDFSEEEIQEQLAILGYRNIPRHTLREFKRDLDELILPKIPKGLTSPSELNATAPQPSPPAYTNQKVNQYYIESPDNGYFLDAGEPRHVRQVFTFCQNRGYRTRQEEHSVTSTLPLSPESPAGLEVEVEDTQDSPYTDSHTSTPDRGAHGRHFIKRKVLRKHKGQFLVCDESVHSEESDASSVLEERLAGLHVSTSTHRDPETESEDASSQSDDRGSENDDEISFGAFESYIRAMAPTQELRPRPKSFIRPVPVTRTINKTDPVTKYFEYKREWDRFKVPGEQDRRQLRSEIRERLATQPPPPKPQRVYVPNTYVVPTEKKRSALRWQVKNDLANGLMPSRLYYQF